MHSQMFRVRNRKHNWQAVEFLESCSVSWVIPDTRIPHQPVVVRHLP